MRDEQLADVRARNDDPVEIVIGREMLLKRGRRRVFDVGSVPGRVVDHSDADDMNVLEQLERLYIRLARWNFSWPSRSPTGWS